MIVKPLQCADVIRQLVDGRSSTSEGGSQAAIDQHLAGCPGCADWASNDALLVLKGVREARPELPNEAKWDGLWKAISERLDEAQHLGKGELATTVLPMRKSFAGRRRLLAISGFGLAQAAAVYLALSVGLRTQEPARGEVDIEAGAPVMIEVVGTTLRSVALASASDDPSRSIDPNYDFYNAIEAMANN